MEHRDATPPFDAGLLDQLLQQRGIDLLLVTSKPNIRYLLGGHISFFFEHADAIGQSRYLPVLVYPGQAAGRAGYIGDKMESWQQDVAPLWVSQPSFRAAGSVDAMRQAVGYARDVLPSPRRIGVEMGFLPADAFRVLQDAFPDAELVEALPVLERLRARKTPGEIDKLRKASDGVIDAMLAVMTGHGPGRTKHELVEALRREETARGLEFDYCLITAGTSHNRAPSDQRWERGDILSLDSGGNYQGYIGDVCRMAIMGEPDGELTDLLGQVDAIQQAAMRSVRAGVPGGTVYAEAEAAIARSPERERIAFVAHGMGLVSHEVPHLTGSGPVPYEAEDAAQPLQAGLVLSIETTLKHQRRGFIKLEDTALVTANGFEMLGTAGRGWNRGGSR